MNITSLSSPLTPLRSPSSSRSLGTRMGTGKRFPLPPMQPTEPQKESKTIHAKITALNQQLTNLQNHVKLLSSSFYETAPQSPSEIACPQLKISHQTIEKLQDTQKQLQSAIFRLQTTHQSLCAIVQKLQAQNTDRYFFPIHTYS